MTPHHRAKKRFGQNFLQDPSIIERIVRCIAPQSTDNMVEIGPGLGALTQPLATVLGKLSVVEIDSDVIPRLNSLSCAQQLDIHLADALTFDFSSLAPQGSLRVVGNLPYNISTPLLFHLIKWAHLMTDMHFMLQKEVVDRIAAVPGNKVYGRLSVAMQYYCRVEKLMNVPPEAFTPKPKVDSAIIRLIPKKVRELPVQDEVLFLELIKQAFGQRRKTLRNTLKTLVSDAIWEQVNIDASRRAESLSVADFVNLAAVVIRAT